LILESEKGVTKMDIKSQPESLIEQKVTYTLELDGKFYIIENVPARVNLETGERFFSPETVEKLQQIIWEGKQPNKTIETPVYEFI
jgi:YgiT-type zinc finger domain-containing protein